MFQAYGLIRHTVRSFFRSEEAADAFEYLMVVGGVVVAVIIAIVAGTPGLINPTIEGVCGAIDSVVPGAAFVC